MFDYVVGLDFKCPFCGCEVKNATWQTKELERMMITYEVGYNLSERIDDELAIHNSCPKCHELVRAYVEIESHKITNELRYMEEKVESIPLED